MTFVRLGEDAITNSDSETTNSPHVDILTCEDDEVVAGNDGPNFTPAIRLHGAHGEEVVRDTWFVQDVSGSMEL